MYFSRLSSHLLNKHKDDPDIKSIKLMTGEEKTVALEELRNRGIYKHNQKVLQTGEGQYQCRRRDEKRSDDILLNSCTSCKQFISKTHFNRQPKHKENQNTKKTKTQRKPKHKEKLKNVSHFLLP